MAERTRADVLEQIINEAFLGWEKSKAQATSMSPHPKPEFLQVALDAAKELYGDPAKPTKAAKPPVHNRDA